MNKDMPTMTIPKNQSLNLKVIKNTTMIRLQMFALMRAITVRNTCSQSTMPFKNSTITTMLTMESTAMPMWSQFTRRC